MRDKASNVDPEVMGRIRVGPDTHGPKDGGNVVVAHEVKRPRWAIVVDSDGFIEWNPEEVGAAKDADRGIHGIEYRILGSSELSY
jgi:hypothetical protein